MCNIQPKNPQNKKRAIYIGTEWNVKHMQIKEYSLYI